MFITNGVFQEITQQVFAKNQAQVDIRSLQMWVQSDHVMCSCKGTDLFHADLFQKPLVFRTIT